MRSLSIDEVAAAVIELLPVYGSVQVEGLGVFHLGASGVEYEAPPLSVFIAYVDEDRETAGQLFDALKGAGFDPWMDKRKLRPGEKWVRGVERAIMRSEFFLACFSKRATGKRGQFQAELRFALECAKLRPLDEAFVVPVRLEPCTVPMKLAQDLQWVDLFPDWDRGVQKIVEMLRVDGPEGH